LQIENAPLINWGMTLAFIFATFITLVVIVRIWNQAIAKESVGAEASTFEQMTKQERAPYWLSIVLLTLFTLGIGFGAEFFGQLTQRIAHELLNPVAYIRAVGLIIH